MDEIYYIEEIEYYIKKLKDDITYTQWNIDAHGIGYAKSIIGDTLKYLELYCRGLRDKLYENEYEYINDDYDINTQKYGPDSDIDNWNITNE